MSRGNNPIKVLRTALKRVQKGWTKNHWSYRDDNGNQLVCLEGALFGYCDQDKHGLTDAQKEARDVVLQLIHERFGKRFHSIPSFNDANDTTKEDVEEVIKLAIIRLETSDDGYLDDEDIDDLIAFTKE